MTTIKTIPIIIKSFILTILSIIRFIITTELETGIITSI